MKSIPKTVVDESAEMMKSFSIPNELEGHPRYEIVAPLGAGGMGTVYKAKHRLMDRLVAIKVITPDLMAKPMAVERFVREVKAAAKLEHPNIVRAYDAEKVGDLHLLVMEFVQGHSLADVMSDQRQLPVATACEYLRQTALGLQHALVCGMIHRDIKPANLMLTNDGVVKILDFGLARFVSEQKPVDESTQEGMLMGSLDYLAPEQARDAHSAQTQADIYSMGCTLYHLLAGRVPFTGATLLEKLRSHRDELPVPVNQLRSDVPIELGAIVAKMMAKDPTKRYQSPSEAAEALRPFAEGASVPLSGRSLPHAEWGSVTVPNSQSVRRKPLFAFAMVAVVLIAGLGYWAAENARTKPDPRPNEKVQPTVEVDPKQSAKDGGLNQKSPNKDEPISLEEWLKGRKTLTVAIDGTGDFRTIQQALDAVKSGEVVIVKGKGPYTETPRKELPANVGLISRDGTTIEVKEYDKVDGGSPASQYKGAWLKVQGGFRMSGLEWVGASLPMRSRTGCTLELQTSDDVIVEKCNFRGAGAAGSCGLKLTGNTNATSTLTVRENKFVDRLQAFSTQGTFVVSSNWFTTSAVGAYLEGSGTNRVTLDHNVFQNDGGIVIVCSNRNSIRELRVHNNNFLVDDYPTLFFTKTSPAGGHPRIVSLTNNIVDSRSGHGFVLRPEDLKDFQGRWVVDRNCYQIAPKSDLIEAFNAPRNAGAMGFGSMVMPVGISWPTARGDIVIAKPFLSMVTQDKHYLRIAIDGKLASGGAGGDLPKYFGAFPPGPAPKEGDWFTRLLEVNR